MDILETNGQGATLHLDPRELLMVMTLVQEGRDSFECDGETGAELDRTFARAVARVIQASVPQQRIVTVQEPLKTSA
ncbi:MAG: hypothetical protein AAGA91_10030 [Pseudomonadota bacterium]